MDMITKIEIEDAIQTNAKVSARVRDVAKRVGDIRGEFGLKLEVEPSWHMDAFVINKYTPKEGMEHLEELAVRTCWSAWVGDDEDSSRYRVTRTIQFPVWYLTEEGWEEREQRRDRNVKRALARLHLDAMRDAVSKAKENVAVTENRLAAMVKLAGEKDEEV